MEIASNGLKFTQKYSPKDYTAPKNLIAWADDQVNNSTFSRDEKRVLRAIASDVVTGENGLRGDITDAWVAHFGKANLHANKCFPQ